MSLFNFRIIGNLPFSEHFSVRKVQTSAKVLQERFCYFMSLSKKTKSEVGEFRSKSISATEDGHFH